MQANKMAEISRANSESARATAVAARGITANGATDTRKTRTALTTSRTVTSQQQKHCLRVNKNISSNRWRLRGGCAGAKQLLKWGEVVLLVWLLQVHAICATEIKDPAATTTAKSIVPSPQYSQPVLPDDDSFKPIIPKYTNPEQIAGNVFTQSGQYRVLEPLDTDLRAVSTVRQPPVDAKGGVGAGRQNVKVAKAPTATTTASTEAITSALHTNTARAKSQQQGYHSNEIPRQQQQKHSSHDNNTLNADMKDLEQLLTQYVENFYNKGQYEPTPALVDALRHNRTEPQAQAGTPRRFRQVRHTKHHTHSMPRALQTGRLLFFTGLKKVLWPIFMGLQILKSLLFALFLPTLIGSVGKLLGKGIISGSAPLFVRPMEPPQEVDFKDNTFNFDDDNKFMGAPGDDNGGKDEGYGYNQAEASQQHNQYAYHAAAAAINQQALSRYGNEQQKMQDSYLSALQSIGAASFKNSNSFSAGSSANGLGAGAPPMRNKPAAPANMNTFQTFQKVPASSLLLSNYDPFYSPLLSRLDSVFAQLKLNSESEACREKLICLMYANPAKYAPYSNLVSAQLSRELNELRKPTSDNPDILRFFKYMRAAKDGQDGVDCEQAFDSCREFKDFENPAMVSTYHDINKLVQARKMT